MVPNPDPDGDPVATLLDLVCIFFQCLLHPGISPGEGRAKAAFPLAVPGRHSDGAPRRRLQAGRVRSLRRGRICQERPDPHVRQLGSGNHIII